MPSLPPVGQVLKVAVKGTQEGPWNNIFHLQYVGPAPTAVQLDTLAASVLTAYTSAFASVLNTAVTIDNCKIADLTSATAAIGEADIETFGTRTGANNPSSVACVVSWSINLRYRGGHPRTYLPAGTQEDLAGFTSWSGIFVGEVLAAANSFRTAMNALTTGTTTYKMVIVSYSTNNAPRPQPLPFLINAASVDNRVDTQRRRLGKDR
jgi:hypothetical protein